MFQPQVQQTFVPAIAVPTAIGQLREQRTNDHLAIANSTPIAWLLPVQWVCTNQFCDKKEGCQ